MTPPELYEEVLKRSELKSLHPLHEAMMRSCCEGALMAGPEFAETDTLVFGVQLSFVKMNEMLRHSLQGALANAGEVTISYRGNNYTIPAGSPLAG